LKITTPIGTELALMENIIGSVTDFIEKQCGRRFKKTTYTQEMYSTEESETLNLKNFPVISTAPFVLERRDSSMNEDDWEVVDTLYYHIDYTVGMIIGAGGLTFARTINGYRVTYTAGYDFDNVATFLGDTEAADVELAAWILISSVWNTGTGAGANVQAERIGDYSVTYAKTALFDDDLKKILDKYAQGEALGMGVITPVQS
jgi:hypothetical protein